MYSHVCGHTCVGDMYVKAEADLGSFAHFLSTLFIWTGHLLDPVSMNMANLAPQFALEIPVF